MPTETPAVGTPAPAAPAFDEKAFQAGLNARLRGETPPDEEPKPDDAAAPAAGDVEDPAADEAAAEDGAAEEEEEKADDQVDDDEDAGEDDDEEPVDKDALRKLQKEKRSFEKYKAGVLAQERTVKERTQKLERAEREVVELVDALNSEGVEALLRHGLIPEGKMALWSRQLFLLSPEGLKDPRSKPEAERIRRELALEAESKKALTRVEKLEQERAAEKAQAEEERAASQYVARIDQSVPAFKAKTPLLTKAMESDPAETKRELYSVAYELANANNGQFVDPGKVVLTWEKRQRALIARLGLSAPAAATPASKTKAKPQTAAKHQGQKQKGTNGAPAAEETAGDPDIAKSDAEFQAELRKRLKRS